MKILKVLNTEVRILYLFIIFTITTLFGELLFLNSFFSGIVLCMGLLIFNITFSGKLSTRLLSAFLLITYIIILSIGIDFSNNINFSVIVLTVITVILTIEVLRRKYNFQHQLNDLYLPSWIMVSVYITSVVISANLRVQIVSSRYIILIPIVVLLVINLNNASNKSYYIKSILLILLLAFVLKNNTLIVFIIGSFSSVGMIIAVRKINNNINLKLNLRILSTNAILVITLIFLSIINYMNYGLFYTLNDNYSQLDFLWLILLALSLMLIGIRFIRMSSDEIKFLHFTKIAVLFLAIILLWQKEINLNLISIINTIFYITCLNNNKTKYMLLSSAGGHYAQLSKLARNLPIEEEKLCVLTEYNATSSGEVDDFYHYVNKGDKLKYYYFQIRNLFKTINYFFKYLPDVILSTGTHVAVPMFVIAKLFGRRTIYVESFANIYKLSVTGEIMRYIADIYYVQHEELLEVIPKAKYVGEIYNLSK